MSSMRQTATGGRPHAGGGAGYAGLWQRTLRDLQNNGQLYLMALPVALGFLLFTFVPMYGLVIVFQDYNLARGIAGSKWIGLANFARFANDPFFIRAIRNTVILGVLDTVISFPMPIMLALSLNEVRRQHSLFKRITQTISYLPHFIAVVVVVGLIGDLFKSEGVVNRLLGLFGLHAVKFLGVSGWFRPFYIGSHIWQEVGWGSIIYLAALSSIPLEQYESAIVDGANRWQQIRYITLPGILPTVRLVMILSVAGFIGAEFQRALLLQVPITYNVSDVIDTYVYRAGLLSLNYSYGSAVGLVGSVVAFVMVFATNWLAKRTNEERQGLW